MASVQLKKSFFFVTEISFPPFEVDSTDILQHCAVYYYLKAPNQCRQVTPK